MKIAIMQPYFFPYLGYFKLMSEIDNFIILDDVQFTRRGWINRNFIKNKHDEKIILTIPVNKNPINTKINQMTVINGWTHKHVKTFSTIYGNTSKVKEFNDFYITLDNNKNLVDVLTKSIMWIKNKIKLNCEISFSSQYKSNFSGEERIIDLCKKSKADKYFNLPGGIHIYDEKKFEKNGIKIEFLNTDECPKISIIDQILK